MFIANSAGKAALVAAICAGLTAGCQTTDPYQRRAAAVA